jgi:DNA/RNA endonuclease YhcR with UshA esterase domain
MKFIFRLVALAFLAMVTNVQAANPIPATEAATHVGQTVTIQGKIAEVKILKNGEAFLRVGALYPHQLITGYIAALKTVADDTWLDGFNGKTVNLHGRIDVYGGKPEIKITSRDQVSIVQ